MKKFSEILDPTRIIDVNSREKTAVLKELIDAIATSERIIDKDAFSAAILEREEILSTGIGFGIGIPHAKVDSVKDFVMAVGRAPEGIEFEAFDHEPVNIIVMIGASAEQKDDYIRILAKVSRILKREDKRKAILEAPDSESIYGLFTSED